MKRYDTYKDSGVQWLGEIPGHWKHAALNKVSQIILGKMLQGETKKEADILVPYICAKDVHFDGIDVSDLKTMYFSQTEMNVYRVCKGDMLLVEGGAGAGNCAILRDDIEETGIQNSIMIVRGLQKTVNNYICYFMSSIVKKGYVDFITNVATIPHFTKEKVSRTIIPLPPLSEQHSIVSYLDDKCGKIDKMLEGKQKQIELLAEMKQRVIADAVTRGLNPDVKMKATGISWLPEVPEHWEMLRNKVFLSLTDEKVGNRKDVTLLSLTKQGVIIRDLSEGKGKFPKDFDTYLVVRPNNLVFCLFDIDETPRTVGLVHNYGMLTGAYTNFEVDESIVIPEFAYYYYLQVDDKKGLRPYYTGLRKVVKTNTFYQLRMPIPPLAEQQAIVSYINERVAKIDTLAAKLQKEIESIKEYKQRLISDVVTGQIKVC